MAAEVLNEILPPGTVIAGRYVVEKPLGAGGMGMVFLAADKQTNTQVAIKLLRKVFTDDARVVARFRREIALQHTLQHAGIVQVLDSGQTAEQGHHYIALEYVAGESLKSVLAKHGACTVPEVIHYVKQICGGLIAAHERGIVHRDISAGNILLADNGSEIQAKISDFGVARALDSPEKLTRTNEIVGSTPYASPEQLLSKGIDHRSDIYSLGILAFEMLTGKLPFEADNHYTMVYQHLEEPLPSIRAVRPAVPEWLETIVVKMAAKNPDDRFQSAGEIVSALEESASQTEASPAPQRFANGGFSWASIVTAGVLLIVTISIGFPVIREFLER